MINYHLQLTNMEIKSYRLNHRSDTQDTLGPHSRAESYKSSILARDLDSSFPVLERKTNLAMMGRQLNYGVLTQNAEEEYAEKFKVLEAENRSLRERIIVLENQRREESEGHDQGIRLKEIAESQYISGMKSMYERNTQLSEQTMVYERELKGALYKVSQLQKQLEEVTEKCQRRMSKSHELGIRIREIQEKYHNKIVDLQECYEKQRATSEAKMREQRFQIENLKADFSRQKSLRAQIETSHQSLQNTLVEKQLVFGRATVLQAENRNLLSEIGSLKDYIARLQSQNTRLSQQKQKQSSSKHFVPENVASSTIAALAIENIALRQQQEQSSKTIVMLKDRMKTYQSELSSSQSFLNKQNHAQNYRQSCRKERHSSVDMQNASFTGYPYNVQEPYPRNYTSINGNSISMRPRQKQSQLAERNRNRQNLNEALVRRSKELNHSLLL